MVIRYMRYVFESRSFIRAQMLLTIHSAYMYTPIGIGCTVNVLHRLWYLASLTVFNYAMQ